MENKQKAGMSILGISDDLEIKGVKKLNLKNREMLSKSIWMKNVIQDYE